jgi:IS30 family transposase
MAGKRLTADDHDRIWELHGEGNNPNEIAVAVGRAYSTVATLLKSSGGVRPVASKRSELRLSLAEREEISRGIHAHGTFAVIAARIGRVTSTVSREVARNGGRSRYRAVRADRRALKRARRPKPSKITMSPTLRAEVEAKLRRSWSPEQIARWLRRTFLVTRRCRCRTRRSTRRCSSRSAASRPHCAAISVPVGTGAAASARTAGASREEPEHGAHHQAARRGRGPPPAWPLGG